MGSHPAFDIVLLYAGICGFWLVLLSFNVMFQWVRVTGSGSSTDQGMRRAERVLSSFIEVAPLYLVLFFLIEMRGAPSSILHLLGVGFVVGRVFHALGSNSGRLYNLLRFVGTQLTFFVLMIQSLACVYLYVLS